MLFVYNFVNCVFSDVFLLINFLNIVSHISCFFVCFVPLYWMPDVVQFTLLSVEAGVAVFLQMCSLHCYQWRLELLYSCRQLGFCPDVVKSLEISLTFLRLVSGLCADGFLLELIGLHYWDHTLRRDLRTSYVRTSLPACLSTHMPFLVPCQFWELFWLLLHGVRLPSLHCLPTYLCRLLLKERFEGPLCPSLELVHSIQFPPFWDSVSQILSTSASVSITQQVKQALFGFPFLVLKPRNSPGSDLGTCWALFVLWVELCPLQNLFWSPNPQYLRMWLYLM